MARPRNKRTFGEIQERTTRQGKRFYPRYSLPGVTERFTPGVGFTSYELAARWLDSERELWEKHVAAGTETQWQAPTARRAAAQEQRERDSVTVGDMLGKWLEHKATTAWEESTRQTNQRQLDKRILEVEGEAAAFRSLPLSKVTRADANNWWNAVWTQFPETTPTNNAAKKHLTAAFKWATREGMIPANPVDLETRRAKVGDEPHRVDLPTREELSAILHATPEHLKFPTALAYFHGLRTEEVLGLRRWQVKRTIDAEGTVSYIVDLSDRKRVKAGVRLTVDKRQVMVDKPLKTSNSYREVPVFAEFNELAQTHLDKFCGAGTNGLVAQSARGNRLTDVAWNKALKSAAEQAGVRTDIRKHDGRRFIATELLESGMSSVAVGAFIGDRNPDVLREHYLRHSDEHLTTGLQAVGERLKGAAGE